MNRWGPQNCPRGSWSLFSVLMLALAAAGCAGPTTELAVDEATTVVPALMHCDGHFVPKNASAELLVETLQQLLGVDGPFLGGRLSVVGPSDRPGVCIQATTPEVMTPRALVAGVTKVLRQLDRARRKRHLRVNVWDVAKGTIARHRTVLLSVNGEGSSLTLGPSVGWKGQPFYIELQITNPDSYGPAADDLISAKWVFEDPALHSPNAMKAPRGNRTTSSCSGEPLTMELKDGAIPIFTLLIEASESTKVPPRL